MDVQKEIIGLWDKMLPWLLDHGIKIVFIALISYILVKVLVKIITRVVKAAVVAHEGAAPGEEESREKTLIRIFAWVIRIVFYLMAAIMIIQELGVNIGPLLASAGIVGVAVGFGSQYLVKDLITGLFMIFENQYRIGDEVDFTGTRGVVEDITLRTTTLRDVNGTVHTVPHGDITRVSNFSKSFARVNLDIGISYNADIDQVITIVNSVGEELSREPGWIEKITKAPYFLRVNDLGDSSVVIKIAGETQPKMQYEVTGELRKRLKQEFDKAGIEIPFPQVVIHKE